MSYDVGDTPEQRDLSGLPVACPVCGQVHERCIFTAGSLYCTRPDCRKPHHREPRQRHECRRGKFRPPPLEQARLGASRAAFASHQVNGLYALLFAEAGLVTINPARFRSDEAQMQVMKRIAGILGDLETAIRLELGADQIPPKPGPAPLDTQRRRTGP